MRLKSKEFSKDLRPVDPECHCHTCQNYTRALLHMMFKENNALASQLLTKHNVSYMMRLMRTMRQSILEGPEAFEAYVKKFLNGMFPKGDVPLWVVQALAEADIEVSSTLQSSSNAEDRSTSSSSGSGGDSTAKNS